MADIVQTLATQTGIPTDTVQKAIGALLSFLKEHHGEEILGNLKQALPKHAEMMTAFDQGKADPASGGMLASVAGLASKFLGGSVGEGAKLMENLGRTGLSVEQMTSFLPKVIEQFESLLPADVLTKIKGLLASAGGSQAK